MSDYKPKPGEGFCVRHERCEQCLFTPNRIVSRNRASGIIREIDATDRHFECHKGTANGVPVCCRGDYDRNPFRTNRMRMAARLGIVRFTDDHGVDVAEVEG